MLQPHLSASIAATLPAPQVNRLSRECRSGPSSLGPWPRFLSGEAAAPRTRPGSRVLADGAGGLTLPRWVSRMPWCFRLWALWGEERSPRGRRPSPRGPPHPPGTGLAGARRMLGPGPPEAMLLRRLPLVSHQVPGRGRPQPRAAQSSGSAHCPFRQTDLEAAPPGSPRFASRGGVCALPPQPLLRPQHPWCPGTHQQI